MLMIYETLPHFLFFWSLSKESNYCTYFLDTALAYNSFHIYNGI